jgi:tetratricopeptide (TPR) repeat protein
MPLAERATFWADRVKARPDDFLSLVQLALVDAERARLTADLGAYDQALALIDRSLEIVPAYPPTIRARSSVRFAIHDFSGATSDATSVLEKAPDDATALAVLGDSALELGKPAEARAAYDRLAAAGEGPWVDVRRARLAYLTGDPARAVQLAARARAAATDEDPGNEGFYDYAHGEFARLSGDAETARHAYEAALTIRATDLGALVGLARIEAATGDAAAAIATLRRAAAIAPQPETLALLGDLLASTGDDAAADEQFATVRLTRTLSERAGAVYDRQLVAFELDHGGASEATLDAARASLVERPDAAGHDLVSWALHRLGRDEEAAAEIDAARADGIVDARILFHAGAVALARGDAAGAEALLDAARALGPALDPRDAAELAALAAH